MRLTASNDGIAIRVAARGATFPVEIDPLMWLTQARLVASDGANLDTFGSSVALSGDTALVGAYFKNNGTGAAYAFVRSGTTWSEQHKLVAPDAAADDYFGRSTTLSGDTALVGASAKNTETGAAYVFVRSGSTWTEQQKLGASDGASGDQFGYASALSGDVALVGAFGKNNETGAAYVFVRSGTTWTEQEKLSPSDGASNDRLGSSVALSGDTALVGASRKNSSTGAAYVFVRSGTTWTEQQKLVASDAATDDYFGQSVALSGDTALIAASGNSSTTGAAYVFVRSGTTWTEQQKLVASDGATGDWFGGSAALWGDTALIGAYRRTGYPGAAYVFVRSGATWTEQQKLVAIDAAAGDYFGYSAAVSGDTALIGAITKNSGAAYVSVLSDCASGFYADGYCCDTACTAACRTCSATPGTCTPVTNAEDVDTCAGSNTCDASGACKKKNAWPCSTGGECASTFCIDGHCCNSACAGSCESCSSGTCSPRPPSASVPSCAPYRCDGISGACPTSCASDMYCSGNDFCDANGACLPRKAQASACAADNECLSWHCADGYCCDAACSGPCDRCDGADQGWPGTTNGTCVIAPAGYPGDPACTAYACTGSNPTCTGTQCSGDSDCATGYYCADSGTCVEQKAEGAKCNDAAGVNCHEAGCRVCATGHCVDGACCDSACDGQCQACDISGSEGTCSPVTGAPHGARPACAGTGVCQGACDGTTTDACAFPDSTTACGAGSSCDGQGTCVGAAGTGGSGGAGGVAGSGAMGGTVSDGGPDTDGGSPAGSGDESGCGCAVPGGSHTNSAAWLLLGLGFFAARSRRSSARRP